MKEMSVEQLANYLQVKSGQFDLTIRVHENKNYILVGVDVNKKEVTNEGNQDPNPTT